MTSRSNPDRPRLALAAGRGRPLRAVPPNANAGEITHLRALAQISALHVSDWPGYGTVDWLRLAPDDPRVYAGTLEAAELHRMGQEHLYANSYKRALETLRTAAEAAAARKSTSRTREPHRLTATPGWPPIQIPGRPGEYLTYQGNE